MSDAWQLYYEQFRGRAERVGDQAFGRADAYSEAAHDAYQATADHLTREHGWSDDRTLTVMRGLNSVTKQWIDGDGGSWDELRQRLETVWSDFTGPEASPPLPRPDVEWQ